MGFVTALTPVIKVITVWLVAAEAKGADKPHYRLAAEGLSTEIDVSRSKETTTSGQHSKTKREKTRKVRN